MVICPFSATPESFTDDHLILPKLTDYLDIPVQADFDDPGGRSSMPPGAMTVSMSADDLSSSNLFQRGPVIRKGETPLIRPIRPDHRYSSEDVRSRKLREQSIERKKHNESYMSNEEFARSMRANSWNR